MAIFQLNIKVFYDNDGYKSPLETIYSFTDIKGNSYNCKTTRISPKSYMRFIREFEEGLTEVFEQMVKVKDMASNEIGTGLSEQLRTTFI
jgi:hypothetical protein